MSSNKNNNKRLKIADNLLTPKEQQQQFNSFISAGVEESKGDDTQHSTPFLSSSGVEE